MWNCCFVWTLFNALVHLSQEDIFPLYFFFLVGDNLLGWIWQFYWFPSSPSSPPPLLPLSPLLQVVGISQPATKQRKNILLKGDEKIRRNMKGKEAIAAKEVKWSSRKFFWEKRWEYIIRKQRQTIRQLIMLYKHGKCYFMPIFKVLLSRGRLKRDPAL